MLATLDMAALVAGLGLVALAARTGAQAEACERAGGALLAGALVGLGVMLARAGG